MKKISAMFLAITIILSLMLTGCGGGAAPTAPASSAADKSANSSNSSELPVINDGKTTLVSLYSSTPGGMWYTMNSAMSSVWQKHIPNLVPRLTPGGGIANCKSIIAGEANLGMTHTVTVDNSIKGNAPFEASSDAVRCIAAMAPTAIQIIVPKDSDIKSLADLGNKRIGLGFVGALQNDAILEILETEYGFTAKSIVANGGSINYLADSDVAPALQDKQVDVIAVIGSWPKVNLEELTLRPGIRLIDIDQAVLDRFVAKHPAWTIETLPAGTYAGVDYSVKVLNTAAILACHKDLDEDLVYVLTRTFWENIEEAKAASNDIKLWTNLEFAVSVADGVPVHPGAEKYYKEIGAIK